MLELFCRSPAGVEIGNKDTLTRIAFGGTDSLSAILLNDAYYALIIGGRRVIAGLPGHGAEQLIPLKARAWLDLSERRARGEDVDRRKIRKRGNDVLRLSQLLAPGAGIELAPQIAADLGRFLDGIITDGSYDPRQMNVRLPLDEVATRIRQAYRL